MSTVASGRNSYGQREFEGISGISGPLNGLKVLNFTTLLPGPYAAMNLADIFAWDVDFILVAPRLWKSAAENSPDCSCWRETIW